VGSEKKGKSVLLMSGWKGKKKVGLIKVCLNFTFEKKKKRESEEGKRELPPFFRNRKRRNDLWEMEKEGKEEG